MSATSLLLTLMLLADERACADADAHGRNQEALACYQVLLESASDRDARVRFLSRISWLHWKDGDFERALSVFEETLDLSRQTHDRVLEGNTINFIGLLHQMLGDSSTALTHYKSALAIARELDDRKLLGGVLYHLGWVHFKRGDYSTAVHYYEQSLPLRRELGDRNGEAQTLLGLGMTHASMSQFEKALQYETEALPLIPATPDRRGEADARDHIGIALTALHRTREAIEQHTLALQIRRGGGRRWSETFSLSGLAQAQHRLGRVDEAAARMKEVVDIIEEGRQKLSRRSFRASLYAGAHGHYERYIAYLMELGDDAGAFSASERSRARLMLDSIQDPRVRADATPLTAQKIQSDVLDEETVLVEYSLGREKSFAWTVTRGAIQGHELPPGDGIESTAVRLHRLLSAGDQRVNRREIETLIDRLSAMLITPLELPRAARRLIVVPDGALFYIPFAALERRGAALIEDYEITTAPSASVLAFLRGTAARRSHDSEVVVFADPVFRNDDSRVRNDLSRVRAGTDLSELPRLPSTRQEAETIVRMARGSRKALDFDASRSTLLAEELGRYRIVHFATHALVNAQDPERSGIVLSLFDRRGSPVDGFLSVADLFDLEVKSDLVVLSACRTAMGTELRGEGIVGLVSGFMHAGAPRVVASFWDVKDAATAELMKRFYRGMLVQSLTPAAALRGAQRSMRREARFQSPYYWASFSLHGLP